MSYFIIIIILPKYVPPRSTDSRLSLHSPDALSLMKKVQNMCLTFSLSKCATALLYSLLNVLGVNSFCFLQKFQVSTSEKKSAQKQHRNIWPFITNKKCGPFMPVKRIPEGVKMFFVALNGT